MVTVKDQLLKSIVICLPLFLSFVPIITLLRMTLVVALSKCFFSVMPENMYNHENTLVRHEFFEEVLLIRRLK